MGACIDRLKAYNMLIQSEQGLYQKVAATSPQLQKLLADIKQSRDLPSMKAAFCNSVAIEGPLLHKSQRAGRLRWWLMLGTSFG